MAGTQNESFRITNHDMQPMKQAKTGMDYAKSLLQSVHRAKEDMSPWSHYPGPADRPLYRIIVDEANKDTDKLQQNKIKPAVLHQRYVEFVAATRPPGQKGRRRTLRLPGNHLLKGCLLVAPSSFLKAIWQRF